MSRQTDQQLLLDYSERRSEPAFAELVRRHVDLIYSAAFRMVRDTHLAEDVTQSVFMALAKSAPQLADCRVLSGWLHHAAQNLAANVVRSEVRRRNREQEAVAMNELLSTQSEASWEAIAPHLDAALGELNEADRDALLLRYFEKKSASEMAGVLGISDEAAQKRVSRAVERLREYFSKRNVTIGASGLVLLISANAVQAAPVGLALTISAAVVAGTVVTTSTTVAIAKTIAMTTLQKTVIVATAAVFAGAGVYQAKQVASARSEIQALQQQQAPLASQISQLQLERDEATNRLAGLLAENARLKSLSSEHETELLKLRGQVAQWQQSHSTAASSADDSFAESIQALTARAEKLNQYLQQMPDKKIPELQMLNPSDWLNAAQKANFDNDADIRKSLRDLRDLAKEKVPIGASLAAFTSANNGQLPTDLSQLKPYFNSSHLGNLGLDDATLDAIIARYALLQTGNIHDFPPGTWFVGEKAPVDSDYDSREKFTLGTSTIITTGLGESGDPDDPNY